MKEKYIPATAALKKLKNAKEMGTAVYIYGATGYGKTKLVKEFLGTTKAIWLSANDDEWDLSFAENLENNKRTTCVVFDDLQSISDGERITDICSLLGKENVWVVLIGRMSTPHWLIPIMANGDLMVISEDNLKLTCFEIQKIAGQIQVELNEQEMQYLADMTFGNAYMIATSLEMLKDGKKIDQEFTENMEIIFQRHLENVVIPQWSVDIQEFLMKLSVVDEFTLPLAVMITGDDQAAAMLSEAEKIGNFLKTKGEYYSLDSHLIRALKSRAVEQLGLNEYKRYICNAGLYYETQDDIVSALKMYEKAEKSDNIRALLIRNGRRHPGSGFYYELRKYYLALEEKEIESSPILMSAMSMLYSILLNPEKSEYWYDRLAQYSKTVKAGEKREADELLISLDIALPHRGSVGMTDLLKNSFSVIKSGNVKLPEFSITNNCPTAMNGGKDFCEWSKKDQLLADTIGKVVERVNGNMGRGLVHAALCESFYEKGGRDAEVAHHAMLVHMDVEGGGKNEILFVAVGIQARLSMLSGNRLNAFQIVKAFDDRIQPDCNEAMIRNLTAFKVRLLLMAGDSSTALKWMDEAPDELADFCVLDRYRYTTKVLCYLEQGKNREAIWLLDKLNYYAENYQRFYIKMENGILLSIAYKREKDEWKETFLETLNMICGYQFVRIISEKGAGVLPLLKEIKKEYLEQKNADAAWFSRVIKETELVAERCPGYLNSAVAKPSDFGDVALTVLKMQAAGYSAKQIAEHMDMSERTVKYHAAENYRKLDAKGKTDAVQKAKSMNLI